ncbi:MULTISPECIES: hypothetical protein [unclassified Beijerinckia]|uniref:hypothetical protein n=1 Tax=unclassified Beijerinckia TaxID=2638183 RepID=UPI00089A19D6|nr:MULTISPECIES: hypothetical protein [unclassified Beijerinckia]MDH7794180.1 hypothetical protein [Beijerinckia sp. GAS462]SEB55101.1 hypothetical protein SAMN05443249_0445 [Beijerinckia sp. 28-YEA-48]
MTTKSMFLGALLALTMTPVLAQGSNAINVSGTVDKIDANSLVITVDSGTPQTFALSPNLVVLQNKAATLADIKPNDFVASAAVPKEDGKLHSTELRIFPEALRGLGEGQRPMNDARQQTMTNATVTGAAVVNGSNNIKVKFAGGESELVLDPGVPVTRIDAADKSLLKSGVKVRAQGVRGADGAAITRITILQ